MPILFFVNCERTVLFSVKRDLDPLPPPPPLYHPLHTIFVIYVRHRSSVHLTLKC